MHVVWFGHEVRETVPTRTKGNTMNVTRNGQSVAFEVNAAGDLEQTSPYVSKAGDANREYVAYLVEDVIVIAQDRFLARQALKQHRVELVEAMRAELDAAEAAEAATLTTADIERMYDHEDWAGRGYLFERSYQDDAEKVAAADAKALDAANRLGLTYEQMFEWANSRVGRWFGDCMFGSNGRHAEKYVPGATVA
jgi:hypothetical protein